MSIPFPNKPWKEGDTFTNDETGVEYIFDGVKWLASGGEELDITEFDDRYVNKESPTGDHMMGPFDVRTAPGTGSRDSRRINTLGVYSNSDNSSLQLGTVNTRIYVGSSDTSFNGPIKVGEITDRGSNIKISAPLQFAQQDELMEINTNNGNTQNINVFKSGNSDFTTVKVNINGATWKNAIEFESGPSAGKETILRLDANKGIKARNLNMDDTRITSLDDPTQPTDAVNLRTVEGKVDDLAESLRDRLDTLVTDNSSGEMKFSIVQAPTANGQFTCMTINGGASTYDPLQTREIWANNTNLSGYDFGWGDVKPNSYFFMSGPGDALARFRVVAAPEDQGTWSKIKVADAEVYPEGQQWVVNDIWDVLFRSFTGESTDLDDYVKKSGDTMTGTLEAPRINVKKDADAVLLVEGNQPNTSSVAARITMSNAYNSNAYGKIEWHGTTGSNGWFQFDKDVDLSSKGLHGVDHIRFKGSAKNIVEVTSVRIVFDGRTIISKANNSSGAGFELRGHTAEGNDHKLLQVYHNGNNNLDAINYYGKTQGDSNLATVGYVKSIVSGDSDLSGDTPFTPYGPMEVITSGGIPNAGEISFGSTKPSETSSIALSKTDKDGKVWDYKFNSDSIFTVTILDDVGDTLLRQTISIRVDAVEDRGGFIVLTTDGRDITCKQREDQSGDYYFTVDPLLWCYNWGAKATPLQKVPVTFDELYQFRDETSVFPSILKFKMSTDSGDTFSGAGRGRIYFEGSLTNPSNIRLATEDTYGYGFLGKADKTSATAIVSCPGEMTVFARSTWSKQIVPVEGYYFDSLYFNHSKKSMRLQNWGKSWDDGSHHTLKVNEEVFIKFDFSPKAHTSARMEEQIAELTARLAKLEGGQ